MLRGSLMFIRTIRFLFSRFLKDKPGNHRCVSCRLYDHETKTCNLIVFIKGQMCKTNLKKVPNWNPFRKCMFYPEMIDKISCFDINKERGNILREMQDNPEEYESIGRKLKKLRELKEKK